MKKRITAAQLMARLNADPEFVARRAKEDDEMQKREAEFRREETPLIDELRAAGVVVESAWDLVNTAAPYPDALPILLKHVQRPYTAPVREGIARALAVPGALFGWSVLTALFRAEGEKRFRDGLAAAIAAMANDDFLDDVISLARDRKNGPSRVLLLSALERSKDLRASAALIELEADPELSKEIEVILRRRLKRARRRSDRERRGGS